MPAISVSQSKKKLVTWIESLQDKTVLRRLEKIREEVESGSPENYMLPGKPLTVEELKDRVLKAREAVLNGDYITDEELTREMKTW
jgi:preprotein translocase subunit SecA